MSTLANLAVWLCGLGFLFDSIADVAMWLTVSWTIEMGKQNLTIITVRAP